MTSGLRPGCKHLLKVKGSWLLAMLPKLANARWFLEIPV